MYRIARRINADQKKEAAGQRTKKRKEIRSLDVKTQTQKQGSDRRYAADQMWKDRDSESKEEQSSMNLFSRTNYAAVNSAKTSHAWYPVPGDQPSNLP